MGQASFAGTACVDLKNSKDIYAQYTEDLSYNGQSECEYGDLALQVNGRWCYISDNWRPGNTFESISARGFCRRLGRNFIEARPSGNNYSPYATQCAVWLNSKGEIAGVAETKIPFGAGGYIVRCD
jgi:hypothetical protein